MTNFKENRAENHEADSSRERGTYIIDQLIRVKEIVGSSRFFDDYDIGRGLRDQAISILSEWSKRLDDSDSPTDKRLWALVDGLRGRIQNINNLDGKNDEKTLELRSSYSQNFRDYFAGLSSGIDLMQRIIEEEK